MLLQQIVLHGEDRKDVDQAGIKLVADSLQLLRYCP